MVTIEDETSEDGKRSSFRKYWICCRKLGADGKPMYRLKKGPLRDVNRWLGGEDHWVSQKDLKLYRE